MKEQIESIRSEFSRQSATFDTYMATDVKKAFNENAVNEMKLTGNERVLEVAAGTCAFGRMIAPKVSHITELDVTEAMLSVGRKENERAGIKNADYIIGEAESLPFENESFDIAVSRLAFHHFLSAESVFKEMSRVVKSNGKIVIADMLAKDEPLRESADQYEKMRDPSHIRCLCEEELSSLAEKYYCTVEYSSVTVIPMKLLSWLELTDTPLNIREKIVCDMQNEIGGKLKTGFFPYMENGELMFDHQWLLMIIRKKAENV